MARSPEPHGADASPAPTVFRSPRGPTFERYRICLRLQPREANLNNRVGEVVLPGRAYPWRAEELASEQRGSGSAARGRAYWSRIDQGTAVGVARNCEVSETEAQSGRRIDVVALEKAVGQSAVHLREHDPGIEIPLWCKPPIDSGGDPVECPGALRVLGAEAGSGSPGGGAEVRILDIMVIGADHIQIFW